MDTNLQKLSREHGTVLLRRMLLIRRLEEKGAELYPAAKIRGFLHLFIGEEVVGVGATGLLELDEAVISTYRDHRPQVALVGFGRITEEPCARDGMIGVHPILNATLAADHRATDGRVGAEFLDALNQALQHPETL